MENKCKDPDKVIGKKGRWELVIHYGEKYWRRKVEEKDGAIIWEMRKFKPSLIDYLSGNVEPEEERRFYENIGRDVIALFWFIVLMIILWLVFGG